MDIKKLMEYLSLGRNSAMDAGKEADAVIRFKGRTLYDRKKIDEWIDRIGGAHV